MTEPRRPTAAGLGNAPVPVPPGPDAKTTDPADPDAVAAAIALRLIEALPDRPQTMPRLYSRLVSAADLIAGAVLITFPTPIDEAVVFPAHSTKYGVVDFVVGVRWSGTPTADTDCDLAILATGDPAAIDVPHSVTLGLILLSGTPTLPVYVVGRSWVPN